MIDTFGALILIAIFTVGYGITYKVWILWFTKELI